MKTYQSGGGYYFKEYNNGKKVRISREQYMKSNKSQKGGRSIEYVWAIIKQKNELHIVEKKFFKNGYKKNKKQNINNKKLKIIELDFKESTYNVQNKTIIKNLKDKLRASLGIKYDITFDRIENGTIIYNISPTIKSINSNNNNNNNHNHNMPSQNNGITRMPQAFDQHLNMVSSDITNKNL